MTLAIAWLNKSDNPTSLNLATDSLLSSRPTGQSGSSPSQELIKWPYAPKIFRVGTLDEYIAYCGDSAMALNLISQSIMLLGSTTNLCRGGTPTDPQVEARVKALNTHLSESAKAYPGEWAKEVEFMYAAADAREGSFKVFSMKMESGKDLVVEELPISQTRYCCIGCAAEGTRKRLKNKMEEPGILASRAYFETLVEVIDDELHKAVGGPPQMVTIQKGASQVVGVNWEVDGRLHSTAFGIPLHFKSRLEGMRFFDRHYHGAEYTESCTVRRLP
jgi:hypothetical protein